MGPGVVMVTTDQWRKLEDIFHAALKINGEERKTFIATVCGDGAVLRREIESLLVHEPDTDRFLESAVNLPPALGTTRVLRRGVEFLLSRTVLQAALILPLIGLTLAIVKNHNQTIAEVVRNNSLYLYLIAGAVLCLRFR